MFPELELRIKPCGIDGSPHLAFFLAHLWSRSALDVKGTWQGGWFARNLGFVFGENPTRVESLGQMSVLTESLFAVDLGNMHY